MCCERISVRILFQGKPRSGSVSLTHRQGHRYKYRYGFGDGDVSPLSNPTHTYYKPGTYTVNLTVWGLKDLKPVSTTTVKQNLIVVT